MRFLRWDYCSVIIPADRLPATGRACRRYKLKYKDSQAGARCLECVRIRAFESGGMDVDGVGGMQGKEAGRARGRGGGWKGVVRRVMGL
tara:strand:- start:1913 stop:2179 length:267 start_codon:yes stop_codon:yes gene_type:complete